MFHCAYLGVPKNSNTNCSTISGGSQVAPSRTEISLAVRSFGCTFWSASTLILYSSGESCADFFAQTSFSRTLPERYSSAIRYFASVLFPYPYIGFKKITPLRSAKISSSGLPESSHIYSISIQAFSPIDTASASLEVSTEVTGVWGLIVLLKNISAFFSSCPSSPKTSRAESKENELSCEKAEELARLFIRPYFAVKVS